MSKTKTTKPFDTVEFITDYETGVLGQDAIVSGFQHLIDAGTVWHLQGSYGRFAQALIDGRYCTKAG